ncbi:hypothetical protein [Nocardioides zeae]|uniref:Uncharacterized protein n=1 Tax=Nocardioides zeae TaxID=1457234 RepID=A0AAJ1U393_9ACTN|nr:hypothetical protein [Nocardioides zeae]MDQ1106514.1 hypothetical protein [Nocardioides zeae]
MLKFALVLAVIAIGVYLLVRALEKRRPGGGSPARPGPARPMGPDDDPDFLWDLNKKVRRPRGPAADPEPTRDPSDPSEKAPDDLSGLDPDGADPLDPRPDRGDEPPEPIR